MSFDLRAATQAGLDALRAGDAVRARAAFEEIAAAGRADAGVFTVLAVACQRLKDEAGMAAALDKALALDPHNLRALLMKADLFAANGEARYANALYRMATAVGANAGALPPDLADGLARAQAAQEKFSADMFAHIRAALEAEGYSERKSSSRFTQSLDLLAGRKQPYIQQPRAFYFPELPQIQFYPREQFAWLDNVEAATDDIAAELGQVLARDGVLAPYLVSDPNLPSRKDYKLIDSLDWSAFFLWKNGAEVAENAALCPKTMAALADAPLARIKARAPSILFSVLKPGAHIEPHTGFLNARLICHLPLICPPDCHFRVGNDTRQWVRGKAWVFDDSIEHEAWNASKETRVVLIFDVWRPELTEEERRLVAALLESIDTYAEAPAAWSNG